MPTPELQNYITQSRTAGLTDDQIRQNLLAKGWQDGNISQVLIGVSTIVSIPTNSVQNSKKSKLLLVWLIICTGAFVYLVYTASRFSELLFNVSFFSFVSALNSGQLTAYVLPKILTYLTPLVLLFLTLFMWRSYKKGKTKKALVMSIIAALLISGSFYYLQMRYGFAGEPTIYSTLISKDKNGFEKLLKNGADPNGTVKGPKGEDSTLTLMELAAASPDSDWLRMLLDNGGNPNLKDHLENPILFDALSMYPMNWDNFDLLIAKGADINAIGRGANVLTYLALVNRFPEVERILNKYPDIDYKDKPTLRASLAWYVQNRTGVKSREARERVKIWLQNHGIIFPVPESEYHPGSLIQNEPKSQ